MGDGLADIYEFTGLNSELTSYPLANGIAKLRSSWLVKLSQTELA